MADVFISYAREDLVHAQRLVETLTQAGCTAWWDPHIRLGEMYPEVIERELEAARCVVVLWSRHSVKSEFVREEADSGKKRGILVPIRLDDAPLPYGFRMLQTEAALEGSISEACIATIKAATANFTLKKKRPPTVAIAAGVTAILLALLVLLILNKRNGDEPAGNMSTSSTTIAGGGGEPPPAFTQPGTTTTPPPPHPRLAMVDQRIGAIDNFLTKLEEIESTADAFYGPVDGRKIRTQRTTWERRRADAARDRERCKTMTNAAEAGHCYDAILREYRVPEPLPPSGKRVAVVRTESKAIVNFARTEPFPLVNRGGPYTKPLTVLVKGKWTGHFTGSEDRCVDIVVGVLQFRGAGKRFALYPDAKRAIAQSITGTPLPPPKGSAYAMPNWPHTKPLSVEYFHEREYPYRATCNTDPPYVLLWQNDPRINSDDPYAVLSDVTP